MSQLKDARMDPFLIMFRRQETVLQENVRAIEDTLACVHRSRTRANIALAEVQTAARVREIELGVEWWACDCGARTMNRLGCAACLERRPE